MHLCLYPPRVNDQMKKKKKNSVITISYYALVMSYPHVFFVLYAQGGLHMKDIQRNFRKIFSILVFNELYLFA